ncbi:hypothetical protein BGZ83_000779 [Gryganskiella cystojenkinii]|nr:hypothetical protein BGZ83_000779 [Gryganskiella cystojenkinii]
MPYRETIPFPDPEVLPWFVIKAKKEHEKATVKYERELQEYQQQQLLPVSPDQPPPKPPTPPRPMIQYKLIQPKQYPESIQHPHPAFRVSFMTSKKLVSKLAVDRNMVKKKMVAAVEAVFRGDPFLANDEDTFSTSTTSATKKSPPLARRGYEYLIFPTKEVMFMTQDQLMKLLIWELKNPKLYGGRPRPTENGTASNLSPSIGSNDEEERIRRLSSTEIKIRWKNNQPPKPELVPFWKHAAPHPLGRVQQSNAFLNRASPEAQQALAPLREKEGRRKKASMDRNSRRQRRNSKAFKSSIMCAAVGEGV